jgi:hypothetical protein
MQFPSKYKASQENLVVFLFFWQAARSQSNYTVLFVSSAAGCSFPKTQKDEGIGTLYCLEFTKKIKFNNAWNM